MATTFEIHEVSYTIDINGFIDTRIVGAEFDHAQAVQMTRTLMGPAWGALTTSIRRTGRVAACCACR